MFPNLLLNGIWHTTSPDRFKLIIESGFLLPEPAIANSARWSTSGGPKLYPYVRTLGGVSLFDFTKFDESAYQEAYPSNCLYSFVPYHDKSDTSIWIRFQPDLLQPNFISGADLLKRRREENATAKYMALVEAAHIGPIPLSAIESVYLYKAGKWSQLDAWHTI